MCHSVDVRVLNDNGEPIAGIGVKITIDGFVCGGSLHQFTDDKGHAHFDTGIGYEDYEDFRELTYAGEHWFGPYQITGGSYAIQLE